MNGALKARSTFGRGVVAAAAAVETLRLAGFIDGLATRYATRGAQLTAQTVVSARV
jgi:hypothetical protein